MRTDYFVGLDLGQSQDFTALAVVERGEIAGVWDGASFTHAKETSVRLRHMERIPLGTAYPEVVARVRKVMGSVALAGGRRYLVVDATGVGQPVVDLLEREGLPCKIGPVTITGGANEGATNGTYRVPKRDLIIGLQVRLQEGELQIAAGLKEGATLVRELGDMGTDDEWRAREVWGSERGARRSGAGGGAGLLGGREGRGRGHDRGEGGWAGGVRRGHIMRK